MAGLLKGWHAADSRLKPPKSGLDMTDTTIAEAAHRYPQASAQAFQTLRCQSPRSASGQTMIVLSSACMVLWQGGPWKSLPMRALWAHKSSAYALFPPDPPPPFGNVTPSERLKMTMPNSTQYPDAAPFSYVGRRTHLRNSKPKYPQNKRTAEHSRFSNSEPPLQVSGSKQHYLACISGDRSRTRGLYPSFWVSFGEVTPELAKAPLLVPKLASKSSASQACFLAQWHSPESLMPLI